MSCRFPFALTVVLACTGLASAQTPQVAPANYQSRVGKVITIQEASRAAERCTVLEAWEMADGNIAMQVRSLQSNQLLTVVEQTKSKADDRFLIYRWTSDGLPPSGCPVAPGMKSMSITKNYPAGQTLPPESKPAPSNVVQADAKTSSGSGVVQASAKAPASTSAVDSRPITTQLPRVIEQGQPKDVKPMPAPPGTAAPMPPANLSSDGTVGRLVTVAEHGKPAEQCVVLEITCLPDGSTGMKVQSLCTGEIFTLCCCPEKCHNPIRCFLDKFRCSRHCQKGCECICEPCPCPVEKVEVLPKPKEPAPMPPKAEPKKPATPVTKVEKNADPLLPPTTPVAEKPKAPEKKEPPKVAQKPVEQPKLPPVNPKDAAPKPPPPPVAKPVAPPAETKIIDAKPLAKPVEGVMVPVPLVPLTTTTARPDVPPPQPVTRPFGTLDSKSILKADAEPRAPMTVPSPRGASPVIQATKTEQPTGYQPRLPMCNPCTPVAVTGWTSGPYKPVTEVPPAIDGVKRASYNQDPVTAENTVYLMTVLQSSGIPSQREWAASRLCKCDARVAPYVIDALVTCAKSDPAALVRVACIQSLVKLQARSSTVVEMLQQAKQDRDPRVADEAGVALSVLSDAKPEVKQTGFKATK
jgi:hypothetical protein